MYPTFILRADLSEAIPGIVLILVAALLIFKTFLIVKEASAAVVERFGKFQSIRTSGLSLMIPFIDNKTSVVNLRVQQLDVTIETKTLDNVFVNLQVSVQYQVRREYVKEAYYSLENAKNQIASYVFDDVRAEVPKLELDDVFAKKEDIAIAVQSNISESMAEYGYKIIKALITDIDPDHKVKDAMNRINAAKRDRQAAHEEGEAQNHHY
jgi:regulator of protease activity HflC (stomatin/prohibitin superfamily)